MLVVSGRRGFTLAELMISILLLAVVGGAISEGLRRQQQAFRSIALMVTTRGDVRDAAEVVAADLATASPLDTLPFAGDSAVEFFSAIGVSVSCDSAPGYQLRIPPEKLASGLPLTAILATPDSGDLVLLYNDDSASTGGVPRWDRHAIASVASQGAAAACPASTGFTTQADAAAPAHVVTLRTSASSGIARGAPARFVRRTRYSLYRSSDSRWYLGSRRCNALGPTACSAVQPVSGPYLGYASGGPSGVGIRYFDERGTTLPPWDARSAVARLEVAVRARSPIAVRLRGDRAAQFMDSALVTIALRNRD